MVWCARTGRGRPGRLYAWVAVGWALPGSIGCAGFDAVPAHTRGAFEALPARVDSAGREHVAVFAAPTPGYQIVLTRTLPGEGHRDAYVTIRQPNPAVMYAQVVVEQRVGTTVPTDEAVRVHARLVPHDAPAESDEPFAEAARAEAKGRP
jgi:hypothetical protein